ncbi:MAG TPA: hypothetical protein VN704_05970 [Verrucomicrobiae bacterium]|nr:hypothetical protein [Verrucomicrobiae bacterium]
MYILGFSFRNNIDKALSFLKITKISHVLSEIGFKSTNKKDIQRIRNSKDT